MEFKPAIIAKLADFQIGHVDPIVFWILGAALLCFASFQAGVSHARNMRERGPDAEYKPSIIPGLAHLELGHSGLALLWFFATALLFCVFWPAAVISIVTCYNDAKRIEQSDRLKRKAGLR
jgi:hypothetical protein